MAALLTGILAVQALVAPGSDGFSARLAEAARNDGLGPVITELESLRYQLSPPKVGGQPSAGQLRQLAAGTPATASAPAGSAARGRVALQPPISTVAQPALRGEGDYRPVVTVAGQPAVQVAYLRPDTQHTSYLTGVVWMSNRLTRLVQHPGAAEPGNLSLWSQPPTLPPAERAGLVATFNGGFKLKDSRGGYFADRHAVRPLAPGAASLVIYRDGHADIGSWGSEVAMGPTVVSVRQNLRLLVDGGRLAPNLDQAVQSTWGETVKGALYVWRSGVGITAAGDLVYVTGAALSAQTLAALLRRAGAVRAMQLDINPAWVSFMWYSPGDPSGTVLPHKLNAFQRSASRYFSRSSRDFFAVYTR